MAEEAADTPQRWTAKQRAALVLSLVKGETSVQAAARKHGLTVARPRRTALFHRGRPRSEAGGAQASERRVCRTLGISRTVVRRRSTERAPTVLVRNLIGASVTLASLTVQGRKSNVPRR